MPEPDPALVAAVREAVAAAVRPTPALLHQTDAIEYVGISRSCWFRLRAAGRLPHPVAVEGSGVMFRRADLDRFVSKLKPAK